MTTRNVDFLFPEEQITTLNRIIRTIGEQNSEISGILMTGSLAQNPELPEFVAPEDKSALVQNYFDICMGKKRKVEYTPNSDLDIWISTRDVVDFDEMQADITEYSIELIEQYDPNNLRVWYELCDEKFEDIYKERYLYSKKWKQEQGEFPWLAETTRKYIIQQIRENSPQIETIVESYFGKELEDFLEVRAYPEGTFNLRPVSTQAGERTSQVPVGYILTSMISEHNTRVLFADKESGIYPFNPKGKIPGEGIKSAIRWSESNEKELYANRFKR